MGAFKRIYIQNSGTAFEEQQNGDLTTIPNKTVQLVNAGNSTVNNVAPGETIDTSNQVGNSNDVTDFDKVRLVFRDRDVGASVDQSPPMPVDELELTDLNYERPAQQVNTLSFPSPPSTDEFWTVKVTDLESGNQPFERRSYEVEVQSSWTNEEIVEAFVDRINNREDQINDYQGSSVYAGVTYATNAKLAISGINDGDTFTLTIDGSTYQQEEVDTDERATFEEFIEEFEDTTLSQHGVTFEIDSNDDLLIFQTEGYNLDLSFGGDLAISQTGLSTSPTSASGTESLRLTGKDVGDIFDVATRGFTAASLTTDVNPTDGVGTPMQLERYEKDDDGTVGRYVESTNLLGSLDGPPTYTQPDGQYDLLTFTWDGDSEKAVNKSIARQTYIVALEESVVDGATESAGTAGDDDYIEFFDPAIVASG